MHLMTELRHPRLLLVLLGLLFIATGIGLKDPWPSDEPRFALVAKEMVESGDWFFPTRGGELYPDKPPLFMWSQAVVYAATGSIRLASALPSLLAGLVTLLLVFDAGRRLHDIRTGFAAGVLLLLTPQFVLEARAGQLDAMVTAWIALGMYAFLRYLFVDYQRRWLWIGMAACGFGIITKGVGFLPLLAFLPWLFVRRWQPPERRPSTTLGSGLTGMACMLGAIALWLVPMLLLVATSDDPAYAAYRDNILFKQTGERYVAPSHHFKPWWYFLGEVIPSLWLTIVLLLPWLVPTWWRKVRSRDALTVLLLGWVALVVLFFSLSPAKRGVYILPALPWLCLAAAPAVLAVKDRVGLKRTAVIASGAFALLASAAAIWLRWVEPERVEELVEQYAIDPVPMLWWIALGTSVATIAGAGRRQAVLAWGGTMLTLWLAYGLWAYPRLDEMKSGRALLLKVEEALAPDQPLALVDWKEQTILQARRPTTNFGFLVPLADQTRSALEWLDGHPDGALLVQGRAMAPCFDEASSVDLGIAHRRLWYIVTVDDVVPGCEAALPTDSPPRFVH